MIKKKLSGHIWLSCEELDLDCKAKISLQQLRDLILVLQKKYGKNAIIYFDAGYNHVYTMIKPTKQVTLDDLDL